MPGLLGDERQDHEAQVAVVEDAAGPSAAAATVMTAMVVVGAVATTPEGAPGMAAFVMSV